MDRTKAMIHCLVHLNSLIDRMILKIAAAKEIMDNNQNLEKIGNDIIDIMANTIASRQCVCSASFVFAELDASLIGGISLGFSVM